MDSEFLVSALFVVTRATHFGACLLLFGVLAFDRFIAAPVFASQLLPAPNPWEIIARWLILLALPATVLSGLIWLGLSAITMSGLPPAEALRIEVIRVVLTETHFGNLWELRAIFLLATLLLAVPAIFLRAGSLLKSFLGWTALVASGPLAMSLAWAGHGLTGEPARSHLVADALHVLIGGLWPVGLLPLVLLLWKLRRTGNWVSITAITRRFSIMALASVAVLLVTGLVNSWILVGSIADLLSTLYGRVLIAKIVLFVAATAVGATNLVHIKPRLSIDLAEGTGKQSKIAAARLQLNVIIELAMTAAIFLLVGLLGLLPPAMEAMLHKQHHHG